jgi:hypothetical protein
MRTPSPADRTHRHSGPWNARLVLAALIVAGMACIPSPASPTETPVGYPDYIAVYDDTNAIVVEVPTGWDDVDGQLLTQSGQVIAASVYASPNLDRLMSGWDTPGVMFNASRDFATFSSAEDLLQAEISQYGGLCDYTGTHDYDDPMYIGQRAQFDNCAGTNTTLMVITGMPKQGEAYIVWVVVQIVSDRDWEAYQHVIDSFQVVGTLPAAAPVSGYMTIRDDYNSIQVDVPAYWNDIDGSPIVDSGVIIGAQIWASPDLYAFQNTWTVPGLLFEVSDDAARVAGYQQILDARRIMLLDSCELVGREDYQDALYRGKMDTFRHCGGPAGPGYVVLAAVSRIQQGAYLIIVEGELFTLADWDAFQRILDTFIVIGDLP